LSVHGDGNWMTPSHAVKHGTYYRYYVSGSLITKDRTETSAGLRIPTVEIEHLVSSRVHGWLLDPSSIYKSTWGRLTDASTQQRPCRAGCRHRQFRQRLAVAPMYGETPEWTFWAVLGFLTLMMLLLALKR
jgi:hypothetical protein